MSSIALDESHFDQQHMMRSEMQQLQLIVDEDKQATILSKQEQSSCFSDDNDDGKRPPEQLWKQWNSLANKSGQHRSVFWVQKQKLTTEQKIYLPISSKENNQQWKKAGCYAGEWQGNQRHGFGTQEWPSGKKYEGDWKKGNREGTGTMYVQACEGKKLLRKLYAGQWRQDRKHGIGIFYYKNGSRYEGEWNYGMRHGHGTFFCVNGTVYIGEWLEDKQCGWGRLIHENGDEYIGEWLNGNKEGQGQFFYRAHQCVYDGEWVNGIAKCGVYGAIDKDSCDNEHQSISTPKTNITQFPLLGVAQPDTLIQKRLEQIQFERAAVRALPRIKINNLFDDDELQDLHQLFETQLIQGMNCIKAMSVQSLLADVGLDITELELAQIFFDLDKTPHSTFTFGEFVKSIYVVKKRQTPSNGESSVQDDVKTLDQMPPIDESILIEDDDDQI